MRRMTPSEITRGIAFRRYAFGKPIGQIAEEAGLPVKYIYNVLKGLPFTLEVAARLEGYLRTPTTNKEVRHDRNPDGEIGKTRRSLIRRIARARALGFHLGWKVRKENLSGFTENQLRAYAYNTEDRVRYSIMKHYPVLTSRFLMADDMEPWEVVERINDLKDSPQACDSARRSVEAEKKALARQFDRANQFRDRAWRGRNDDRSRVQDFEEGDGHFAPPPLRQGVDPLLQP